MNHIHALMERNAALAAEIAALREQAFAFKVHLTMNPKFLNDEPGGRKDWLSTSDALAWLRNIELVEEAQT